MPCPTPVREQPVRLHPSCVLPSPQQLGNRHGPLAAPSCTRCAADVLDQLPAAETLVSPVYLAGAGDGRHTRAVLDDAEGWTKLTAYGADTYYTSPCQRVRIARTHRSTYGGWTVTFAQDPLGVPDWSATFDRHCPDEITAAFTATLADSLGNTWADHLQGGVHYTGLGIGELLTEHGWTAIPSSQPHQQTSPDEHAAFTIRSGHVHPYDELANPAATVYGFRAGPDLRKPSWRAYLTSGTPLHLLTALVTALVDPTPVHRGPHEAPQNHHALVSIRPSAPAPRLSTAALARSSISAQAGRHAVPPLPSPPMPAPPRRQR